MQVPNPMPLQNPWSPAGYQVVEVANECEVGTPPVATGSSSPRQPSSSVGCRVVQIADEKIPARPRRRHDYVDILKRPAKRGPFPIEVWAPIAAGSFVVLLIMGFLVISLPVWSPAAPRQPARVVFVDNGDVVQPVDQGGIWQPPQVVMPANAANLPVREDAEPAENKTDKKAAGNQVALANVPKNKHPNLGFPPANDCNIPNGNNRESFGTSVQFARNPVVASDAATKERKLAFFLHVSGNFEDNAFT